MTRTGCWADPAEVGSGMILLVNDVSPVMSLLLQPALRPVGEPQGGTDHMAPLGRVCTDTRRLMPGICLFPSLGSVLIWTLSSWTSCRPRG